MSRRKLNKAQREFFELVCEAVEARAVRPDKWLFQCSNGAVIGAWGKPASEIWNALPEEWQKRQDLSFVSFICDDIELSTQRDGVVGI